MKRFDAVDVVSSHQIIWL